MPRAVGEGGRGSGGGFGEWERHNPPGAGICGKRVNREKDLVRRVVPGLFGVRERSGGGGGGGRRAGTPGFGNLRAGSRELGISGFPLPPSPAGRSGVTRGHLGSPGGGLSPPEFPLSPLPQFRCHLCDHPKVTPRSLPRCPGHSAGTRDPPGRSGGTRGAPPDPSWTLKPVPGPSAALSRPGKPFPTSRWLFPDAAGQSRISWANPGSSRCVPPSSSSPATFSVTPGSEPLRHRDALERESQAGIPSGNPSGNSKREFRLDPKSCWEGWDGVRWRSPPSSRDWGRLIPTRSTPGMSLTLLSSPKSPSWGAAPLSRCSRIPSGIQTRPIPAALHRHSGGCPPASGFGGSCSRIASLSQPIPCSGAS